MFNDPYPEKELQPVSFNQDQIKRQHCFFLPLSVGNTVNDYQVVIYMSWNKFIKPPSHCFTMTEQWGHDMSCVKPTRTALTCTTERRPVIITRRLGSWVNARDPAITLNTAYTNKPNADTRSRMSFRSLCSSARNLRLWTLSIHKHRYQTVYHTTVLVFTEQVKSLQCTTKWSPCLTLSHLLCTICASVWCFSKLCVKKKN